MPVAHDANAAYSVSRSDAKATPREPLHPSGSRGRHGPVSTVRRQADTTGRESSASTIPELNRTLPSRIWISRARDASVEPRTPAASRPGRHQKTPRAIPPSQDPPGRCPAGCASPARAAPVFPPGTGARPAFPPGPGAPPGMGGQSAVAPGTGAHRTLGPGPGPGQLAGSGPHPVLGSAGAAAPTPPSGFPAAGPPGGSFGGQAPSGSPGGSFGEWHAPGEPLADPAAAATADIYPSGDSLIFGPN